MRGNIKKAYITIWVTPNDARPANASCTNAATSLNWLSDISPGNSPSMPVDNRGTCEDLSKLVLNRAWIWKAGNAVKLALAGWPLQS